MEKIPELKNKNGSEDESNGGDSRYRAKITQEQQETLEELQNFKKTFKANDRKNAEEVEDAQQKEDRQKHKRRAIEVSKTEELISVKSEKFSFFTSKSKWKKIINQLKNLFGFVNAEDNLLKDLITNNEAISSLPKGKNKILEQLKIMQILKELSAGKDLSIGQINKLIVLQKQFINQLKVLGEQSNVSMRRAEIIQKQIQVIASKEEISGIGRQILGNDQLKSLMNLKIQASILGIEGYSKSIIPVSKNNSESAIISSLNLGAQKNPAAFQMDLQYNQHRSSINALSILIPIEKLIVFTGNKIEQAAKAIINEVKDEFLSMLNTKDGISRDNITRYNCNNYKENHNPRDKGYNHSRDKNHNHQKKTPSGIVHGVNCECCHDSKSKPR